MILTKLVESQINRWIKFILENIPMSNGMYFVYDANDICYKISF